MILLAALVLLFLWVLTVSTGFRLVSPLKAVGRRSPVGFLASLCAALALTTNFPPVYIAVDHLLGGRNFASLTQHTFLALASYFVMVLMLRSVGLLTKKARAIVTVSLGVTLVVQTAAFLLISPLPTTTELIPAAHTQVSTLVYSTIHTLYFGVACAVAVVVGAMLAERHRALSIRISAMALLVGGGAGLVNIGICVFRDTARFLGNTSVEALDPIYRVLLVLIAFGFSVGLSVPAIEGSIRRRRLGRTLRTLQGALARSEHEGWKPSRVVREADLQTATPDAFRTLNEAVIRLRDGQMFGTGPELTAAETEALDTAERLLHGSAGKTGRRATATRA
ncbi:hypothetical protein [uncultured Microbacterium sp.]|uniref:hypothetical protein n=1 Tax=uncultured Microbacterium sp. TaxID=191216 RepID=UPI0025E2F013|nr:hypothetical protein [uncultured Microbacterium sp.]